MLDTSVCNNKQRWNNDKWRCKCKELIDKQICDKGLICNPNNCEYECYKFCDVGEYLDYKNCKYRKRVIDKLVEDCNEIIDRNKIIYNSTLNHYENLCSSCTVYIVLFFIAFLMIIGISSVYFYFNWYL